MLILLTLLLQAKIVFGLERDANTTRHDDEKHRAKPQNPQKS